MEVPGSKKNKPFVLFYEMLGSAFLVMTMNWSINHTGQFGAGFKDTGNATNAMVMGNYGAVNLTLGLCVAYMTIMFGAVCGGHFNPAVTIGMMCQESIDDNKGGDLMLGVLMMVAQVLGGFVGWALTIIPLPHSKQEAAKMGYSSFFLGPYTQDVVYG